MSKVLEKSLGGFLASILGSGSSLPGAPFDCSSTPSGSLGLINFVEKLQDARKISKQEEEDVVKEEYQEWLRQASYLNTKNEIISEYLCRSLIAFSRGHYFTNLHINAIKLTQSDKLLHKKIGYLYISRTMAPESDLTVLLVNTVQRDLASPNMIQVSLGLNLLPVILSLDVSSLVSNSIQTCLNHQQSYIKRRAAIMAFSLISRRTDSQIEFAMLIPHLTKLLTNTDPSVAIAATLTLSNAFKNVEDLSKNDSLRDEIAKASAHILLQATRGLLPQLYNSGPINAPFVQVQMLRSIRKLSTCSWNVPDEVISAVESVLLQPWGGRNLTLYMTLFEAIHSVVMLPRNEALILQSLKIILGFLKSSSIDFKYMGIKALSCSLTSLEDSLTQAHLEAVLECLNSSNFLLQSRTIKLLCLMANESNYQAICVTLIEFGHKTNNSSTKDLVYNHLSEILKRIRKVDIPWCISFLSPYLEAADTKNNFLDALRTTICKGVEESKTDEEKEVIVSTCNKLFELLLKGENISQHKLTTVSFILNILFSLKSEAIDVKTVDEFINKLKTTKYLKGNCRDSIFDCLLNCGLNMPECRSKVKSVLERCLSDKDVYTSLKSRETLLLLNNYEVTKQVLDKKNDMINGDVIPDLTMSFCDSWIVRTLEAGSPTYKPFTIKTRSSMKSRDKRKENINPFDKVTGSSTVTSIDKESLSTLESRKSSLCATSNDASGTSPVDRNVWTSQGRVKILKYENEEPVDSNSLETACVELAHEAEENSIIDEDTSINTKSPASSYLESQRTDLTWALLKGLGLSKNG